MMQNTIKKLEELTQRLEGVPNVATSRELECIRIIIERMKFGILIAQNRTIKWANVKFLNEIGYELHELIDQDIQLMYASNEDYDRVGHAYEEDLPEVIIENVALKTKVGKIIYRNFCLIFVQDSARGVIVLMYMTGDVQ